MAVEVILNMAAKCPELKAGTVTAYILSLGPSPEMHQHELSAVVQSYMRGNGLL
jgi:hypothetical protein